MRLISEPAAWAGELPAVLVAPANGADERRELLRVLVARIVGLDADGVEVAHAPGQEPRVIRPERSGLHLSSASRGGVAALAVARGPVGVDIEAVEAGSAVPWNVLHSTERAWIERVQPEHRARAFAQLWAAKEAYLKALRTGLHREPSSFAVLPYGEASASMRLVDSENPKPVAKLTSAWLTQDGLTLAVVLAELPTEA